MRKDTQIRRLRNAEAEIRQLHKEVELLKNRFAKLQQVIMVLDRSVAP